MISEELRVKSKNIGLDAIESYKEKTNKYNANVIGIVCYSTQNAITLIALIITIIILLILVGVTINLTLGENGLFNIAKNAVEDYGNLQKEEIAFANEIKNSITSILGDNQQPDNTIQVIYDFIQLPTSEESTNIKIDLKLVSKDLLITKVIYPDGVIFEDVDGKQEVEKSLNINLNTEYFVECTLSDNSIVNKNIKFELSCGELLIPKMISDTTNEKQEIMAKITADTYYSQEYLPYYAFDRSVDNSWCSAANAVFPQNLYYEYKDGKRRKVENVQFITYFDSWHNAYDVQVYGTNDDINWIPITKRTTLPLEYGVNYTVLKGISNEAFKKFKFVCYNYAFEGLKDTAIWDIQMYGIVK